MHTSKIFIPAQRASMLVGFGLLMMVGILFGMIVNAPKADAAWGPGGSGVGGSGSGFWTSNGFGWKLFPKNGGGPSNGFRDGTSWGAVQSSCAAYSGSGVWVHVVRNAGGSEMSFNYSGSSWNRNRPTSGADPYMYNANGDYSPQGASYQQHVINIIASVQNRFAVEHSAYMSHWGVDVAWFCDGSLNNWSSSGTTTANRSSASPGQTIQWTHTLRNDGPTNSTNIYSQTVNSGFSNGAFNGVRNGTNGALGPGGTRGHPSYSTYTVTQADVGSTLCQQLQWDPTNSFGGRDGRAANVCVGVPFQYTLRPEIRNITNGGFVESSDVPLTVPGVVTNEGPTRSEPNIEWQITQVEYGPTLPLASIPNRGGGSNVAQNPCGYFTSPQRTDCDPLETGTSAAGISFPGDLAVSATTDLANKPAGTKICFALSVRPYTSSANTWRHSALVCLVIGKKPKVQVLSGDLMVGRGSASNEGRVADVNTSTSQNSNRTYGSWAEYAIVPSGCVRGMASGSGYVGGATTNVLSNLSLLTFTNPSQVIAGQANCASGVGRYTHSSTAPNVASRFPIQVTSDAATPALPANPSALPSTTVDLNSTSPVLRGHYQAPAGATSLRIDGGTIGAGRWIVISAPNAVVTIRSNIQYTTDPLRSLSDIPQVVIIARDIVIEDDVEQIDAWLVAVGSDVVNGAGVVTEARGNINTCGGGSAGVTQTSDLTLDDCNRRLTVNGPVVANHLLLRRTAGSDGSAGIGEPAEVFNLRPDAYIWATSYNAATGRLSTVESKELPPRF